MLSVMTQVGAVAALTMLVWVGWGYTEAFGDGGNAICRAASARPSSTGISPATTAATFTAGVAIPEYVFVCFQMTFAAITVALVLGSVVERMKFSRGDGVRRRLAPRSSIFRSPIWCGRARQVLHAWAPWIIAGGTVVHINSGVSALVACLMLGKRIGYPREPMAPHSLTMTGIGRPALGGLVRLQRRLGARGERRRRPGDDQHLRRDRLGGPGLDARRAITRHKPSALGFCSGIVAGLVAVTPAAGNRARSARSCSARSPRSSASSR